MLERFGMEPAGGALEQNRLTLEPDDDEVVAPVIEAPREAAGLASILPPAMQHGLETVSYTHLTLPTN